MFPFSTNMISRKLSAEEFSPIFRELWGKLSHSFFKFERQQSYQEPDNPSFRAFQAGDWELAKREMAEARAKDAQRYIDVCRRGLSFVRIRAVELPLSSYLKWEFETYKISARYGERILVVDISNDKSESAIKQSLDFNIFDDYGVLAPTYDSNGLLSGALLIDHLEHVRQFRKFVEQVTARSEPLAVFEHRNKME